MIMPAVSVIIPTYNRQDLVVEAIRSALGQTYLDFEIIVVDDGSVDKTSQCVHPFRERVQYFYKPNGGAASARNFGIRRAAGDLIAFLDSDDLWEPNFLEVTTAYLRQHPDDGMVSTGWRTWPSGHRWPPTRKRLLQGCLYPYLMEREMVRTSAVLARKSVLLDCGLFNEQLELAEDSDMWLKIAAKYPTAIINMPLSWGRRHDIRLSKNRILHLQRLLQVIESHYDPRKITRRSFDRRRSSIYCGLGDGHLKADDFTAARTCFERAVTLNPLSLRARRYRWKTLWRSRVQAGNPRFSDGPANPDRQ